MSLLLVQADARHLPFTDGSVQTCVTSPPYWGLRSYGIGSAHGEIGLEPTPDAYVHGMVAVFREVRRVLRDDGTCWLNLGDSYATSVKGDNRKNAQERPRDAAGFHSGSGARWHTGTREVDAGLPSKNLVGIPWRVAFALQADAWYLRSDVIWSKPNPMPESVRDRPTRSHEYVFLLTKSERYFYDADAIKNAPAASTLQEIEQGYDGEATKDYEAAGVQNPSSVKARIIQRLQDKQRGHSRRHANMTGAEQRALGSNARTVWTISPQPYPGAHFATMPEKLVERCVLAGSKCGDVVLDPFMGSGTVARVALRLGRKSIGCDLNPAYLKLADGRTRVTYGLPLEVA